MTPCAKCDPKCSAHTIDAEADCAVLEQIISIVDEPYNVGELANHQRRQLCEITALAREYKKHHIPAKPAPVEPAKVDKIKLIPVIQHGSLASRLEFIELKINELVERVNRLEGAK